MGKLPGHEARDLDGELHAGEHGKPASGEPPAWLLGLMDHVEGQVAFGDTKAGLLLTADSILLAGLATAFSGDNPIIDRPTGPTQFLGALALVALSAALITALMTILPNRSNLWSAQAQDRFNFAWIARQTPEHFTDLVRGASTGDMTSELAATVHGKSRWVRRKFARLYVAVWATVLGLVLGLTSVASSAV